MHETSLLQIDVDSLRHNMSVLRQIVGADCCLCPMVKADGYCLGARSLGPKLVAAGADALAVYSPMQAAELLQENLSVPILVLMPVYDVQALQELNAPILAGQLHLTVHDLDQLQALAPVAERSGVLLPLHIEVDTGMGRGGCNLEDAPQLIRAIVSSAGKSRFRLAGVFTHFAHVSGDPTFTDLQFSRFDALLKALGNLLPDDCLIHAANSLATLSNAKYHKKMVRVGQAWIGYGSEQLDSGEFLVNGLQLKPILSWKSKIVHIKTVEKGQSVGYRRTWTAKRRSRIALIPVGYADGIPIGLGSTDINNKKPCVGVKKSSMQGNCTSELQFAPVVGTVNMDQITIDLTEFDPPSENATQLISVGSEVALIGVDRDLPNHLPTLAVNAGLTTHCLLAGLNPRTKRIYSDEESAEHASAKASALVG